MFTFQLVFVRPVIVPSSPLIVTVLAPAATKSLEVILSFVIFVLPFVNLIEPFSAIFKLSLNPILSSLFSTLVTMFLLAPTTFIFLLSLVVFATFPSFATKPILKSLFFILSNSVLTLCNCFPVTASVLVSLIVPSATFVIFLFPASMPLSVTLGPPVMVKPSFVRITLSFVPSFIVTPLLFITVFPVVTLSRPVNSLAKATVRFPSSFL